MWTLYSSVEFPVPLVVRKDDTLVLDGGEGTLFINGKPAGKVKSYKIEINLPARREGKTMYNLDYLADSSNSVPIFTGEPWPRATQLRLFRNAKRRAREHMKETQHIRRNLVAKMIYDDPGASIEPYKWYARNTIRRIRR